MSGDLRHAQVDDIPAPRIVVDGIGGPGSLLLENGKVSVRVYVSNHDDGGLYFEFATERGAGFRPPSLAPQVSLVAIVYPESIGPAVK